MTILIIILPTTTPKVTTPPLRKRLKTTQRHPQSLNQPIQQTQRIQKNRPPTHHAPQRFQTQPQLPHQRRKRTQTQTLQRRPQIPHRK